MKSKTYLVLLVFTFVLIPLLAFSQETLTITTYYPSPYGSYRDLDVRRRLSIGGGSLNSWINDPISGMTDGMEASDAAIFVPVYAGGQSDLRLYIVDDAGDRFSIWGNSCGGGDCLNLNSASNIATFMGNGDVGIGTESPSTALDLNGAFSVRGMAQPAVSPAGQGRIYFDSTAGKFKMSEDAGAYIDLGGCLWATSGNNIYNTNSGDVGIGTANPGYKLDVSGDIRTTGTIYANANGAAYLCGGDDACLYDINVTNTVGVYGVQDSTKGAIKLGTGGGLISGYGFGLPNGTIKIENNLLVTDKISVGVQSMVGYQLELSTIWGAKPGGGTWADSSDQRVKKNIKTMSGALEKIEQLRGVNFEWINPEEHGNLTGVQGGFLAQDVEKVFPGWVSEVNPRPADSLLVGSGQKIKSLSLSFEYDALMVEAIKEQQIEIEGLNVKIDKLIQRIEELESEAKK